MKKTRFVLIAAFAAFVLVLIAPSFAWASSDMAMHRLYNPYTGEHFYTASLYEADNLTCCGWDYEGVGWYAPSSGTPVYRLYNPYVSGGDHHYTTSAYERDALVVQGWRYEGVGWYSVPPSSKYPLYRQYNPYAATGTHNYTADRSENDHLVSLGWRYEGIGWYASRPGHGWNEAHFISRVKEHLRVPNLSSITYRIYGNSYWEGTGLILIPVYFYQNGKVCAFGYCTSSGLPVRTIWSYTAP